MKEFLNNLLNKIVIIICYIIVLAFIVGGYFTIEKIFSGFTILILAFGGIGVWLDLEDKFKISNVFNTENEKLSNIIAQKDLEIKELKEKLKEDL